MVLLLNHFSPIYHRTNYRLYYCLHLVLWLLWTYLGKWKLIYILKLKGLCRLKFNYVFNMYVLLFFPSNFFGGIGQETLTPLCLIHCVLLFLNCKSWSSCLVISFTHMLFELSSIKDFKKLFSIMYTNICYGL